MPITATFQANFDQFKAATVEANTALKVFQDTSVQAGTGLMTIESAARSTAPQINTLHGSLQQFDGALAAMGVHIGPEVRGLGELADASGKTASQLGLIATAGLAVSAAMGGWKIGRAISDFFDLDAAIGNATAKLLGFGDVGGQVAGAKLDVVTLAIKRGADASISYGDALKYNAEWFVLHQLAAKDDAKAVKIAADEEKAAAKVAVEAAKEREKAAAILHEKVMKLEGDYTAFTLAGFEKISQQSALVNAARLKDEKQGYADLASAQHALADDIAKSTLSSSDYQLLKIREVADAQIASFPPMLAFREQYVAAVEALAARQTAVVVAAAAQEVAAAEAAANALLTIVVGHGPDAPNAGAGRAPIGNAGVIIPPDILASIAGMGFSAAGIEATRQMKLRGFAAGGPVLSDGPIYAHAGEYVIPKGGGGSTNVVIYVNGTAQEVAQKVASEFMKTIKAGTKIGTA